MIVGNARVPLLVGLIAALALMVVAIVVALGGPGDPEPAPGPVSSAPTTALSPAASAPAASAPDLAPACAELPEPAAGVDQVLVYFTCEPPPADPRPVARDAPGVAPVEDYLRAAVEGFLAGPTQAERAAGFTGALPPGSEGLLLGVTLQDDGLAVIDLADGIQAHQLNTGHNSFVFFGSLGPTISQFEAVAGIEYRIEGSCEAFERHFAGPCRFEPTD